MYIYLLFQYSFFFFRDKYLDGHRYVSFVVVTITSIFLLSLLSNGFITKAPRRVSPVTVDHWTPVWRCSIFHLLCNAFFKSMFVFLSCFYWWLHHLSFFGLRFLVSNFSYTQSQVGRLFSRLHQFKSNVRIKKTPYLLLSCKKWYCLHIKSAILMKLFLLKLLNTYNLPVYDIPFQGCIVIFELNFYGSL